MKKSLLILALMSGFATSAFAVQPVDTGITCNGNSSCATTNTTNNTSTTTNAGGAGGSVTIKDNTIQGGKATVGDVTAGNLNGNNNGNNNGNIAKGAISNSVETDIKNSNTSFTANTNKQGQLQGQEQSANNEGNTQSITFEAPKTYRPPVSSAIAPTIFPTAPCMGSSSVGATGTLFSISGGTTWTSEECMILETARSFDQAGFQQDGLAVRCQGKWAKNAPSCKALAGTPAKTAVAPASAKTAVAPAPAKVSKAQAEVVVAQRMITEPVYSDNGYYSTVTNPLAQ